MIFKHSILIYLYLQYLKQTKDEIMFMKKPRHRTFDYTPRFYDLAKDDKEKIKRRLGFTRKAKYQRKKRSPLIWIVLLILIIYLYLKFGGS